MPQHNTTISPYGRVVTAKQMKDALQQRSIDTSMPQIVNAIYPKGRDLTKHPGD
ncbi:MAG: hypothetical protein WC365_09200 [Candidatus Babeliales bacterium]